MSKRKRGRPDHTKLNKKRKGNPIEDVDKLFDSEDDKDDNGALSLLGLPSNKAVPHPHTPTKIDHQKDDTELQTPISNLSNFRSQDRSITEAGSGVSVKHGVKDGEYVVKIGRMSVPSSSDELNEEEANQLVQSAGMLFAQAEILRGMGEQLLARYRKCLQFGDLVALITRQ